MDMTPDVYATKCKELMDAIDKFFVGEYNLDYEKLYRAAYQVVLNKFGGELYSAVEAALATGAQDLGRALDAATGQDIDNDDDDDAMFLRELVDMWNLHKKAFHHTRDVMMYLDRTYVTTHAT